MTLQLARVALFAAGEERMLCNADLHHAVDDTPHEGLRVRAWPAVTLSRGEGVCDGTQPRGASGRGHFLECGPPTLAPGAPEALHAMKLLAVTSGHDRKVVPLLNCRGTARNPRP